MIVAVGTDAIEVARVRRAVDHPQWGARFRAQRLPRRARSPIAWSSAGAEGFAARFAAKEAVMKALGTGYARGVSWRDIEGGAPRRPPRLVLRGGAQARAEALGIAGTCR
ncbi:MAG: 4'-phosphopantetheinyl transferase superfamily protein [Candidatus Binatia bacterium]